MATITDIQVGECFEFRGSPFLRVMMKGNDNLALNTNTNRIMRFSGKEYLEKGPDIYKGLRSLQHWVNPPQNHTFV